MYNNNNNNNNGQKQKNIGGLYKYKSKNGLDYLKGKINGVDVVIYRNQFKTDDKHPDYVVYEAVKNNSNSFNQNNNYNNNNNNYNNNNRNNYNGIGNNNQYVNKNNGYGGYNKQNNNSSYNDNKSVENIIPEERTLNGIDF